MSELRVRSRWWYWVAAVPLVAAFWVVTALWMVAVVALVPEAGASTTSAVVSIPAVALGLPALAAYLVMPLAAHMDDRAIRAAGGQLPGLAADTARVTAVVDLVLVAGVYRFFEGSNVVSEPDPVGTLLVAAAVVAGAWLAVRYVRARREVVVMPSGFSEWRAELREGERV
ncbi:hypothetical protein [Halobacterium jilantaiense]|uniref:Uncharacterized protein n=1 Tax=Halobacterium jilantaiense TaxID=355548 RepID=A0A1I0PS73_9EURY|nr:hypothetical protein [Halobacterium jilantaiense]SEW17234.1 hypothetical protein SAMN04487945_1908 [Halobacterium jilantaiense]